MAGARAGIVLHFGLLGAWIGAGTMRDLVWSERYGCGFDPSLVRDLDVVFLDPTPSALTEQMWCGWPARTPKALHFRLYIAVMYWHSLGRLPAGHALGDQYFQRWGAEIAAVWHGERSETGLRQRVIDSIKETADVAHAA
ncbi:hypothetical protein ACN263_02020 [Micromonospora sp. WMMD729]|uniref:hypothetical protein n=1 Tax=Micromonospora sp. WMMD729 TaxID=3404127 RepID=UPI003BF5FC6E